MKLIYLPQAQCKYLHKPGRWISNKIRLYKVFKEVWCFTINYILHETDLLLRKLESPFLKTFVVKKLSIILITVAPAIQQQLTSLNQALLRHYTFRIRDLVENIVDFISIIHFNRYLMRAFEGVHSEYKLQLVRYKLV